LFEIHGAKKTIVSIAMATYNFHKRKWPIYTRQLHFVTAVGERLAANGFESAGNSSWA